MAGRTRHFISDEALMDLTLSAFWSRGELKESDLYDLNGSRARTPELLEKLMESGVLEARRQKEGRRVLMYSLTEKGELLYYVNRLRKELINDPEVKVDGDVREVLRILGDLYDGGRDDDEPPGDRQAAASGSDTRLAHCLGLSQSRPTRELCFYN